MSHEDTAPAGGAQTPVQMLDGETAVRVTINGEKRVGLAEPRTLLVDFIRHTLGLTGTHVGCEHGVCGACTVRVDGELVRSCIMLAVQADGRRIETVESMAAGGELHPVQQAFHEAHGLQCGFCTPGMLLTTEQLLQENPEASEQEIREYLSGNICRCTGYVGVVEAVKVAQRKLQSGDGPASRAHTNGGQ